MRSKNDLLIHVSTEINRILWDYPEQSKDAKKLLALLDLMREFNNDPQVEGNQLNVETISTYLDVLKSYMPIKPLFNTEDEWEKIGIGLFQNRYYKRLFKVVKENGSIDYVDMTLPFHNIQQQTKNSYFDEAKNAKDHYGKDFSPMLIARFPYYPPNYEGSGYYDGQTISR